MKYPVASFTLAILLWFLLAILMWKLFAADHEILPATLDIEASALENVAEQKKAPEAAVEKKSAAKNDVSNKSAAEENSNNKIAAPIYRPLPQIPDQLRYEAFNSYAVARFYINADGSANVELIKPCQNPLLNRLLLQSLNKWRFRPSNMASTQDIKVNFAVE